MVVWTVYVTRGVGADWLLATCSCGKPLASADRAARAERVLWRNISRKMKTDWDVSGEGCFGETRQINRLG